MTKNGFKFEFDVILWQVEDLKDLDTSTIQGMPLDADEKGALRQIVEEVPHPHLSRKTYVARSAWD